METWRFEVVPTKFVWSGLIWDGPRRDRMSTWCNLKWWIWKIRKGREGRLHIEVKLVIMMGWVAMFVHQGREIIDIPIITWSSRSSSEAVGALPFGHIVYPAAASSCGFRRSMYFWYLAPLHFTTCSNMPVHVTLMVWCSLLVKPKSCKSKVWAKRLSTLAWLLLFLFSPWSNRAACIIRTS